MTKENVTLLIEYLLYAFILGLGIALIILGATLIPPKDVLITIGSSITAATLGKVGISLSKTYNKKEV